MMIVFPKWGVDLGHNPHITTTDSSNGLPFHYAFCNTIHVYDIALHIAMQL